MALYLNTLDSMSLTCLNLPPVTELLALASFQPAASRFFGSFGGSQAFAKLSSLVTLMSYPDSITDLHNQSQSSMSKDQLDHVNLENEGFRGHYFRSDAAIHNLGIRMGRRYPCLDEFPVKTFRCFNKGYCKHRVSDSFPLTQSMITKFNREIGARNQRGLEVKKWNPVSIASIPMMYYEKYGKILRAKRPHGQHSVVLAENTNNQGDRNDPCPIVSRAHNDPCPIGSRSQQIYSQKMMSLSTSVKRGNESPGMLRRQYLEEEEDHAFELERRHLTRLKMENSSYFDYAMDGLKLLEERLGCLLDTLDTGSGSDYKAKKRKHSSKTGIADQIVTGWISVCLLPDSCSSTKRSSPGIVLPEGPIASPITGSISTAMEGRVIQQQTSPHL